MKKLIILLLVFGLCATAYASEQSSDRLITITQEDVITFEWTGGVYTFAFSDPDNIETITIAGGQLDGLYNGAVAVPKVEGLIDAVPTNYKVEFSVPTFSTAQGDSFVTKGTITQTTSYQTLAETGPVYMGAGNIVAAPVSVTVTEKVANPPKTTITPTGTMNLHVN